MQAVPAANRPAGDDGHDDFGHKTDQALNFKDMQAAESTRVNLFAFFIFVAVFAADALIAAGTKSPDAVFGRRPVAGEEYAADIGGHARMIQCGVKFVHGIGPESVSDFRTVKSNADRALFFGAVIGDVLKFKTGDRLPYSGVKNF